MAWVPLPPSAAWEHRGARAGFEVAWFRSGDGGSVLTGCTAAVEDGQPWSVDYEIHLDRSGRTRRASLTGRSSAGAHALVVLTTDAQGHWQVDGRPAARLDGCLDVDLESSAMTNALPVRRLDLAPGDHAAAPAAFVRAGSLAVERLGQHYRRRTGPGGEQAYDYAAPQFDVSCVIRYDEAGLALEYPTIAVRVG
jgi:uncharacterized protein